MNTRTAYAAIYVLALAISGTMSELVAQRASFTPPTSPDGQVPVTLILVNTGAPPTVFRRVNTEPRNVIMVDPTTVDAQQLSAAVLGLLIMEATDPDGRARADNVAQRVSVSATHQVLPWVGDAMKRLQLAKEHPISGMGKHRALPIWLPPLRELRKISEGG